MSRNEPFFSFVSLEPHICPSFVSTMENGPPFVWLFSFSKTPNLNMCPDVDGDVSTLIFDCTAFSKRGATGLCGHL